MMTLEVYESISKDDPCELKKLMGVDKVYYDPQIWDGNKIWPKVSRRMTALQLAVREGKDQFIIEYYSRPRKNNALFPVTRRT